MEKIEQIDESNKLEWEKAVAELTKLQTKWWEAVKSSNPCLDIADVWFGARDSITEKIRLAGFTQDEMRKYAAYFLINGGTPEYCECDKVDFEGELSIGKYFKEQIEVIQNTKKI